MTDLTARALVNVVYAVLSERADAADRVAAPVLLAARMKPRDVQAASMRDALDGWLDAPDAATAAAEAALIRALSA